MVHVDGVRRPPAQENGVRAGTLHGIGDEEVERVIAVDVRDGDGSGSSPTPPLDTAVGDERHRRLKARTGRQRRRPIVWQVDGDRLRERPHARVLELGNGGLGVPLQRLKPRQHGGGLVLTVQTAQCEERPVIGASKQRLGRDRPLVPLEGLRR